MSITVTLTFAELLQITRALYTEGNEKSAAAMKLMSGETECERGIDIAEAALDDFFLANKLDDMAREAGSPFERRPQRRPKVMH